MVHNKVYGRFETYFPQFKENIMQWFPNGKNSIRIRHITGQDFVFTFNGKNDWCFETVNSYIKKMRGET